MTCLCVDLKDRSQRPSTKGWSVVANPVSRNSPDSNYSVGWPLHASLTHNLQRTVAPPPPLHQPPRPARGKFFQTTACFVLLTQITVKAAPVQWLLLIHASSAQQSSWNSSEVPPQDESHGSRLCSLSVLFVQRCNTLIHSTERYETLQGAEVKNLRWHIKRVPDVVQLPSWKVAATTVWTVKVTSVNFSYGFMRRWVSIGGAVGGAEDGVMKRGDSFAFSKMVVKPVSFDDI